MQVQLVGPFNGQQPAYLLPFEHEIERLSRGRWPIDQTHVYWIDELLDYSKRAASDLAKVWPFLHNIRVERSFQVGPTRIFRLVGTPGPPPR
jgi:hypothetical protein